MRRTLGRLARPGPLLLAGVLALVLLGVLIALSSRATTATNHATAPSPSGTVATGTVASVPASPTSAAVTPSPAPPTPVPARPASARSGTMPAVAEPHVGAPAYDRDAWRHWVDDDGDCQDTRQEVLIAESRVPVTFMTTAMCRVVSGQWFDEYTGATVSDPGALDVDHFVPLENAHVSGGWAWSAEQRRAYANDLPHAEHLIAVSAGANRSKGSHSPDEWRPPRREYWCVYATTWTTVKLRWALTVTSAEHTALLMMLDSCPPGAPEPAAVPAISTTTASTPVVQPTAVSGAPFFANCREARRAGAAPLYAGQPGYRRPLDGDGDGIACE